jgi:hypothetical protein
MKSSRLFGGALILVLIAGGASFWYYKKIINSESYGWTRVVGASGRLEVEDTGSTKNSFTVVPSLPAPYQFVSLPQGLPGFVGLPSSVVGALSVFGSSILVASPFGGVSLSPDAGKTWSSRGAGQGVPSGKALSVYLNDKIMMAGFDSGLAISRDHGTSWRSLGVAQGFGASANVTSVYASDLAIFAGTSERGLKVSFDDGVTWQSVGAPQGVEAKTIFSLSGQGEYVFAGTEMGIFGSVDSGKTWTMHIRYGDSGLGSDMVRSLAVCGENIFAGTANGLFRSSDLSGKFWTEPSFSGWPANFGVLSIAAYPISEKKRCVVAVGLGGGGLGVSQNNGDGWLFSAVGASMEENDVVAVAFSLGRVVAAPKDRGLSISDAQGAPWTRVEGAVGLGRPPVNALLGSGANVLVSTADGLSLSADGGASWSRVGPDQGIPSGVVSQIMRSEAPSELLAVIGNAVCRASDWAARWECLSADHFGIEGSSSSLKTVSVGGKLILIGASGGGIALSRQGWNGPWERKGEAELGNVGVNRALIIGTAIFVATDSGLAISRDEGVTWGRKDFGEKVKAVALAVDGSHVAVGLSGAGVALSNDFGVTWTLAEKANGLLDNAVNDVAFVQGTLFVATRAGLSSSSDGGKIWYTSTVAQGLGANEVLSVVGDGNAIFVGTEAGVSRAGLFVSTH